MAHLNVASFSRLQHAHTSSSGEVQVQHHALPMMTKVKAHIGKIKGCIAPMYRAVVVWTQQSKIVEAIQPTSAQPVQMMTLT